MGGKAPTITLTTTGTTTNFPTTTIITTTTIDSTIINAVGDATTTTSPNTSVTSIAKLAGSADAEAGRDWGTGTVLDEAILISARCETDDKHQRFTVVGCGTKLRSDISYGEDELFRNFRWAS